MPPTLNTFLLVLAFLFVSPSTTRGGEVEDVLAYLAKHEEPFKQDLIDLASIPSISSLPPYSESCLEAAQWLEKRLTDAGLEKVEVLPTEAKTHQPVVYAEWLHAGAGLPTVLIYGHYDVQPADDLELWEFPPFETRIKDGYFRGRGVDDDKGGIVPVIQVLEAFLQTAGRLPVNVKVMFEGQEEIGSPNLLPFLQQHGTRFAADFALSADGGQESETQGILTLALRGSTAFEVEAKTLDVDVHSGTFGGTVMNPNHALARFIAGLHFPNGSVSIPGFYDDVREITDEDRKDMAAFTSFDEAEHLGRAGATEPYGEAGFTTLERTWYRPTLDVIGQWGGFTGAGVKTIVPGKATAKVTCRLVPDQDPFKILELAEKYVASQALPGTKLTFSYLKWAAYPYIMSKDGPGNKAVAKVLEDMLGSPPLYYRAGGSIPAAAYMQQHLGITMTMFGFGLPSNNIHAPNERFGVAEFHNVQTGYVKVLHEIARMHASVKEEL